MQSELDKLKEELFNSIESGSPAFSVDWVKKNLFGSKDKFEDRKKKIKRILKDE